MTRVNDEMDNTRNRDGFSLVELIMIMLLIGIMVGIVAPTLRPEKFQLNSALVAIASSINAQQRAAVLRQHNVVLAFDTTNRWIRVHYDADNDNTMDTDERWHVIQLDDGVVFGVGGADPREISALALSFVEEQDGMPALTFRRNGSASEESIIYLTSRKTINENTGEDTRVIEIERATGRTHCYSFETGEWIRKC